MKQIRKSPFLAVFTILLLPVLVSCKKENADVLIRLNQLVDGLPKEKMVKRPFTIRTSTWYRISPAAPETVLVNGITYDGFAYFPGGGTGTATHIGNITT